MDDFINGVVKECFDVIDHYIQIVWSSLEPVDHESVRHTEPGQAEDSKFNKKEHEEGLDSQAAAIVSLSSFGFSTTATTTPKAPEQP